MKHLLWIPIILIAFIVGCKKDEKTGTAGVTTTAPSSITANSAASGGTIASNGGSVISKSGVCFATHSNPTLSDSITSDGATSGSYSSSLTNLNANVTYYVRAYAINASGTGYGNTDSFTTSKGVPTVTTTAISNNQNLVAYSGGNVTNDGGASVTARGLCWSTSPHPTITNSKTSDSSGKGSFVDSLTNLEVTTYYVRAYATNSFGTAYGNEITFVVNGSGTVSDADGNAYLIVVVGTQTWMASNLKTTHYLNGDSLVNGYTNGYTYNNSDNTLNLVGTYFFPNGDPNNNASYGKYYNMGAAIDSRGICPAGWHVPTDGDWQTLEFYEGMAASDTGANGNRGTIDANFLIGGTSGLNLQLAGYINPSGNPVKFNVYGLYWTSTVFDLNVNGNPYQTYYRGFGIGGIGPIYRNYNNYPMSVRCIKN